MRPLFPVISIISLIIWGCLPKSEEVNGSIGISLYLDRVASAWEQEHFAMQKDLLGELSAISSSVDFQRPLFLAYFVDRSDAAISVQQAARFFGELLSMESLHFINDAGITISRFGSQAFVQSVGFSFHSERGVIYSGEYTIKDKPRVLTLRGAKALSIDDIQSFCRIFDVDLLIYEDDKVYYSSLDNPIQRVVHISDREMQVDRDLYHSVSGKLGDITYSILKRKE